MSSISPSSSAFSKYKSTASLRLNTACSKVSPQLATPSSGQLRHIRRIPSKPPRYIQGLSYDLPTHTCPRTDFHHRDAEDTEKSFCFSGDTEKQKYSVLKSLHILRCGQILFPSKEFSVRALKKKTHDELYSRGLPAFGGTRGDQGSFRLSVQSNKTGGPRSWEAIKPLNG
jgi:hypothetical protein